MEPTHTRGNIIWLKEAVSTNDEVRRRLDALDNMSVVAAEKQIAGRGQGDHTWHSLPGENLTFSILYRKPCRAADAILVTCATTLGIRGYLLSRGIEARIKWPNDIWVGDRKICGILIENTIDGDDIRESIVGIGLNVNETLWPGELPNPIGMKELTGKSYDLRDELEALTAEICRQRLLCDTPDGRSLLQEEFEKYVFRLP